MLSHNTLALHTDRHYTYPTGSARPLPWSAEKLSRRKSSTKAACQHLTDRFFVRRDNGGDVGLCKQCASNVVVGPEIERRNITRLNWGTLSHGLHLCVTDTRLQIYSANTCQIQLLLCTFINYIYLLECGPMPNVMVALANIGGALCSTPQFGWRPLLECRAVTLPRCETRWNYLGCPKLTKRSQPLVGRSSPYCGDM